MITIVLRALAVLAVGGVATTGALAFLKPVASTDASTVVVAETDGLQPIPTVERSAGSALLARSPFAPDRSAFSREPVAPPVQHDVRLMGVSRLGEELTATLMINGAQSVVRKGDQTPIGPVEEIKQGTLKIGGGLGRTLELFSASPGQGQQANPAPPQMSSQSYMPQAPTTQSSRPLAPPPSAGPSIQRMPQQ